MESISLKPRFTSICANTGDTDALLDINFRNSGVVLFTSQRRFIGQMKKEIKENYFVFSYRLSCCHAGPIRHPVILIVVIPCYLIGYRSILFWSPVFTETAVYFLLTALSFPSISTIGLATNIEEYVPTIIPSMIAKAKS